MDLRRHVPESRRPLPEGRSQEKQVSSWTSDHGGCDSPRPPFFIFPFTNLSIALSAKKQLKLWSFVVTVDIYKRQKK